MLRRSHFSAAFCAAGLMLLAGPAAALADGGPNIVVGPITVHHGYTLEAQGYSCGTQYAGGSVTFTKTVGNGVQTHTYYPLGQGKAKCTMSNDLSSATLTINLGTFGKIDVKLHKHGKAGTAPLPPGCKGTKAKEQPAVAKGTFKVRIAKSTFGKVRKSKVPGSIIGNPNISRCSGQSKAAWFSASFGSGETAPSVNATHPKQGKTTLSVFVSHEVAKTLWATHGITESGPSSLFDPSSNLRSATLEGSPPFLTGTLKFKATSCSTESHAWTGTLSGKLKAHFDAIGTKRFKGSAAKSAFVGNEKGTAC